MAVLEFQDLPLADRDHEWEGDEANKRVRRWADAEEDPNDKYRKAFVWYEPDDSDKFKGYKFQIADVVDGNLKAVPHAVFNAAAVMQGARGGANLPRNDIADVKKHLGRYYDKLGDTPPWDQD
ncbi:MAG: hypothetical protein M3467_10120 [Actinomycetota bacterium]|jgi:hypothetical protein|nr:hypothetical protein [Euzebyaceae bacterium]MDQ3432552.1 hypothetical protein [Actinomycetota bacterium]